MVWSDYLTLATFFFAGFILGAYFIYRQVMQNVSEDPRRMINILEKIEKINQLEAQRQESKESDLVEIKTEVHGGITYLFDKNTDEFLAQGTDFDNALDLANKRFPNRFSVKNVVPDSQS